MCVTDTYRGSDLTVVSTDYIFVTMLNTVAAL